MHRLRRDRVTSAVALAAAVTVLGAGTVQAATVSVSITDGAFSPFKAKAQQGDTVTWTNSGVRQHNVTSDSGLFRSPRLLFDDNTPGSHIQPTGSYSFSFTSSGKYPYRCTLDGFTGVIVVPLKTAPTSGTTTTSFTITWAAGVPAGWVEDIQVKRPGGTVYKDWKVNQTGNSASFTPDRAGTYSFQARLRNTSTGVTSSYAGPKSITVS